MATLPSHYVHNCILTIGEIPADQLDITDVIDTHAAQAYDQAEHGMFTNRRHALDFLAGAVNGILMYGAMEARKGNNILGYKFSTMHRVTEWLDWRI